MGAITQMHMFKIKRNIQISGAIFDLPFFIIRAIVFVLTKEKILI